MLVLTECPRCMVSIWLEPAADWTCANCGLDLLDMRERRIYQFDRLSTKQAVFWTVLYIAVPLVFVFGYALFFR